MLSYSLRAGGETPQAVEPFGSYVEGAVRIWGYNGRVTDGCSGHDAGRGASAPPQGLRARDEGESPHARVYNFSAGPAVLPEEVLRQAAAEMLDYDGTGMSVMEMSHRSKPFANIIETAEADLRELLQIPDNYQVLFLQGGATQQFAAVPMNLMQNKKADYIVSGSWSKKAWKEAKLYGEARCVASSEDENFSYVPTWPASSSTLRPTTCTSARTRPSTAPRTTRCPRPVTFRWSLM